MTGLVKSKKRDMILAASRGVGRHAMPAKNPRVNIVVKPLIYGVMQDLAEHQGLSLSALAKVLITEALELREDAGGGLKDTEGILAELSRVLPA